MSDDKTELSGKPNNMQDDHWDHITKEDDSKSMMVVIEVGENAYLARKTGDKITSCMKVDMFEEGGVSTRNLKEFIEKDFLGELASITFNNACYIEHPLPAMTQQMFKVFEGLMAEAMEMGEKYAAVNAFGEMTRKLIR